MKNPNCPFHMGPPSALRCHTTFLTFGLVLSGPTGQDRTGFSLGASAAVRFPNCHECQASGLGNLTTEKSASSPQFICDKASR